MVGGAASSSSGVNPMMEQMIQMMQSMQATTGTTDPSSASATAAPATPTIIGQCKHCLDTMYDCDDTIILECGHTYHRECCITVAQELEVPGRLEFTCYHANCRKPECMICLKFLLPEDEPHHTELQCGHKFHALCITAWAQRKGLPIDRACPQRCGLAAVIDLETDPSAAVTTAVPAAAATVPSAAVPAADPTVPSAAVPAAVPADPPALSDTVPADPTVPSGAVPADQTVPSGAVPAHPTVQAAAATDPSAAAPSASQTVQRREKTKISEETRQRMAQRREEAKRRRAALAAGPPDVTVSDTVLDGNSAEATNSQGAAGDAFDAAGDAFVAAALSAIEGEVLLKLHLFRSVFC